MPETAWAEVAKYLGVAVPLVMILFYLLRQANEERRDMTDKFLAHVQETVKMISEVSTKTTGAITEMRQQSSQEHREMIQELRSLTDVLRGDRSRV